MSVFGVLAGLLSHEAAYHPFKYLWFSRVSACLGTWAPRDPDTSDKRQSALFVLPLELACVKATLSIQFPVRQHCSE